MPPLANTRHESFAQHYVAGTSQTDAYKRAGFKATGNSAEVNASKLIARPEVAARIAELQAEAGGLWKNTRDRITDFYQTVIANADLDAPSIAEAIRAAGQLARLKGLEKTATVAVAHGADLVIINPTDDVDAIPQDADDRGELKQED